MPLRVIGLVQAERLPFDRDHDVVRDALRDRIFKGFAAPVRENPLAEFLNLFGADVEFILWPRRQNIQFAIYPIYRAFRGNHAHARQQRAIADDQFIRANRDAGLPRQIQQHPGAAQRHRLAFGGLIARGGIAGAFQINLASRAQQVGFHPRNPLDGARCFPVVRRKRQPRIRLQLV